MYSRRQILLPALFALLAFTAGCDRGSHPQQVDKIAPDFTVNDGHTKVHLADYRGKVVVLNFWFSTCPPCIEELPSLIALQKELPQIVVLTVSVDDEDAVYRQFLINHHDNLLSVRDSEKRANELYHTEQFPETYVIDRKGVIRRKFISAQNWTDPEIVDYLRKL